MGQKSEFDFVLPPEEQARFEKDRELYFATELHHTREALVKVTENQVKMVLLIDRLCKAVEMAYRQGNGLEERPPRFQQ